MTFPAASPRSASESAPLASLQGGLDVGHTPATAGVLPLAGTFTGTIDAAGDPDWYGLTPMARVICRFDQETLVGSAAPLPETYLRLHEASGTQLAVDDDGSASLESHADVWSRTGAGLTPQANFLLNGCEIGADAAGQSLLEAPSRLTGADLAASTDATGSTLAGGDGLLATQIGSVQTFIIPAVEDDAHLLANQAPRLTAAGSLDTSFSGDGKVVTSIGTGNDLGLSVAIQPDGRIVFAGVSHNGSNYDMALVRYNTDGSLDTSFSGDGKLTIPVGAADDVAYGVALQPDGKILLAGYSDVGGYAQMAVVRCNADGSLDTGFNGDGKLSLSIGAGDDYGSAIAVQPDAKIVVAGSAVYGTASSDFALARFNADGELDRSFSGDGIVATKLSDRIGAQHFGNTMILQRDGGILVAGSMTLNEESFAIARYTSSGELDTSFHQSGSFVSSFGASTEASAAYWLAAQPDGRILVGGNSGDGTASDFGLARLTTAGMDDVSFAGDGTQTTGFGADTEDAGTTGVIQADGTILVAGYSNSGGNHDFAVVRYTSDGALDNSFSDDGKLTTAIGAGDDVAQSSALQTDGRFVVAGYSHNGSNHDFALTRYMPGGIPDQAAAEDQSYTFTFLASAFYDPDGDSLTYAAARADGSALPAWLGFNATTRTFQGIPTNANVGGVDIKVIATDPGGASVSDTFHLTVRNTNDAPTVAHPIPDRTATEDSAFSYMLPADTFADMDVGDTQTLVANKSSGDALPSWLGFNAATRTFTGTPANGDVGFVDIKVTATDGGGASVSDTFRLTVTNTNDPPYMAPAGRADTGFSGDGRLTTDLGAANDLGWSLVAQADGRIVVAGSSGGNLVLLRYTEAGNLDNSFSSDGKVTLADSSGSGFSVAAQADGKLLVASSSALYRFNADGSPDAGFAGDGTANTGAGRAAMALQADGRIVVAGVTTYNSDAYITLARYLADGSLDPSFLGNGRRDISSTYDNWEGEAVAVQADGKILVAGCAYDDRIPGYYVGGYPYPLTWIPAVESNRNFLVTRYNANGSLDTSFSGDGWVTTDLGTKGDEAYSLAVQADGKILVAGVKGTSLALVRYTATGSLDTGFSGDGIVTTDLGFAAYGRHGLALQADGKILVACETAGDFVLARFNADGSVDASFDGDGRVTTNFGGADVAHAVLVQADGNLLVAGSSAGDLALARYLPGGVLDLATKAYAAFSHEIPSGVFADPDAGDTLAYSAQQADGSALPAWLSFSGSTRTFSGTPTTGDVGDVSIKVTATDSGGLGASDTFVLRVAVNSDVIRGTTANDALSGTAGADTIDGGAGADTMAGGQGNDHYVVDHAGDSIAERAGEGMDSVYSSVSHTLAIHVENLTLTGAAAINGIGNEGANTITGNLAANVLQGRGGNDTLDGGAGADNMTGGTGNDTYIVDNAGDLTIETGTAASEVDAVQSSVTRTLGANLEHLALTGSEAINGSGNALANHITGNGDANNLFGAAGNDTLIGGSGPDTLSGGEGADRMEGGFGGDVFIVDEAGDVVVELAGQGNDRVSTALTYTLPAHVEALTLSGTGSVNGTGNELPNLIQGNTGNNRLTGLAGNDTLTGSVGNDTLDGGSGADVMVGQEGNDTYHVDASGDKTIESYPSFGTDHVITSISRTISTNIENMTLAGTAVLGSGNALANVLTGNAGANTLNGVAGNDTLRGGAGNDTLNGGLGADRMEGGLGNDVYAVDSAADVVVELANEGTDRVSSTVHWVLGANVENLTLAGAAAINGTGNALGNVIAGNAAGNAVDGAAGDDTLSGGDGNDTLIGGAGRDHLTGGTGADRFRFVTTGDGTDTITDFTAGSDKIHVVVANFGLVSGAAARLVVNGSPNSSAATFVYTSATGSLVFDADGNGAGAAATLALLSTKPATLLHTDIVLGP